MRPQVLWTSAAVFVLTALLSLSAQENRGTIYGHVLDPQAAVVAGASVVIPNVDTNVSAELTANHTSYYEAPLLLPDNHRISVPAQGFKTLVRGGIELPVSTCLQVSPRLG
jgi:hypothetical protein